MLIYVLDGDLNHVIIT